MKEFRITVKIENGEALFECEKFNIEWIMNQISGWLNLKGKVIRKIKVEEINEELPQP